VAAAPGARKGGAGTETEPPGFLLFLLFLFLQGWGFGKRGGPSTAKRGSCPRKGRCQASQWWD